MAASTAIFLMSGTDTRGYRPTSAFHALKVPTMPADPRLVIGLDSSTQSTKAVAWDRDGRAVAEGRADIPLSNPGLDMFEQDVNDWWASSATALQDLFKRVEPSRIDALAISNQRETMAFLDARGDAIRPGMVWLDERSRPQVTELSDALGADTIHGISGRHPDVTPCLYRVAWMKKHEPENFARTVCFADVQCFLTMKLTGERFVTGWTSADPTGMFDLRSFTWSDTILDYLGLAADRMPRTVAPGTLLGHVNQSAAQATGLLEGTPILAAGGDGQCAGLGVNATRPDRAYINLGTAVVSGVWSPTYAYDKAFRTELAAQGEGYIFENCLRSGAFLLNWFVDQFVPGGRSDPDVFRTLEAAASELPIGSDGLMVQPYWGGCMDPYWDSSARGVIAGLGGSHKPAHVYRAIIEGMTLNQVMSTRALEQAIGTTVDHYVAIGGGAQSPLWRQMLADTSGKKVRISTTVEASALGAGMTAAFGAGWFDSIRTAADSMSGLTTAVTPNPENSVRYNQLLDIYSGYYAATRHLNRQLVSFASGNVH